MKRIVSQSAPQTERMPRPDRDRPAPARRRQAERTAETRTRILDAACALIAATDFGSATIDAIMDAAGLGRATFYLHFSNKGEIVEEAALRVKGRILSLCGDLAREPVRDEATVVAWMRRLVAMLIEQRIYLRVMTQFHTLDPELRLGGDQWHMLIIESLAPSNRAFALVRERPGENRALSARAHLILFALERFIIYNVLEGAVPDPESCIDMLGQDLHRFMTSV